MQADHTVSTAHPVVHVTRVRPGFEDLPLPAYATPGSAGMDLRAAVAEPMVIAPGSWLAVPTGIAIALPHGFECQVRPRSGLALSHGISMVNTPGTVDEDYRGEIMVIMINHGREPFEIGRGHRIAQAVITRYERVELQEVDDLSDSHRGSGGFGSTGV